MFLAFYNNICQQAAAFTNNKHFCNLWLQSLIDFSLANSHLYICNMVIFMRNMAFYSIVHVATLCASLVAMQRCYHEAFMKADEHDQGAE